MNIDSLFLFRSGRGCKGSGRKSGPHHAMQEVLDCAIEVAFVLFILQLWQRNVGLTDPH